MRFYLTKSMLLHRAPGQMCLGWYEDFGRVTCLKFLSDGITIKLPAISARMIDYNLLLNP